jgi:hypothetical protein
MLSENNSSAEVLQLAKITAVVLLPDKTCDSTHHPDSVSPPTVVAAQYMSIVTPWKQ